MTCAMRPAPITPTLTRVGAGLDVTAELDARVEVSMGVPPVGGGLDRTQRWAQVPAYGSMALQRYNPVGRGGTA